MSANRSDLLDPALSRILDEVVHLERVGTVLEVGCGTGDLSAWLASRVKNRGIVLGLDVDGSALRQARRINRDVGTSNLAFEHGDVNDIPLPDGYADLVVCKNLLCVLGEVDMALKGMLRVLKPGGQMVVIEPASLQSFYDPDDRVFTELSARLNRAFCEGWRLRGADQRVGLRVPALLLGLGMSEIETRGMANASVLCDSSRGIGDLLGQLSTEAAELDPETLRMIESGGMSKASVTAFRDRAKERLDYFVAHQDEMRKSGYTRISAARLIAVGKKPIA